MPVNPPRLAMIIGSTRPTRFAEKPATWLASVAAERDDLTLETLDLRDFELPYFAEVTTNLHMPSEDPAALAWQDAIRPFDGSAADPRFPCPAIQLRTLRSTRIQITRSGISTPRSFSTERQNARLFD